MNSQATLCAELAAEAGTPDLPSSAQSAFFSGGGRERRKMFTSVKCRFLFCSYFSTSSAQILLFIFHCFTVSDCELVSRVTGHQRQAVLSL